MLEVKNLVKTFGDKIAVNNVSFNVENGKILGILGRNGAGKSTIFSCILNILKPDSGTILYNNNLVSHDITDSIGYLPEEGSLIQSYTVYDQFLYYGALKSMKEDEIKKETFRWLEEFNILEYMNMKIKDLSKGNRQKIQFIVSVLHNPSLIILDEPFSGLDPISVNELKNVIVKLKQEGKMIVFSSHRMDHVEMLCEDILILNNGVTTIYGNLNDIKSSYTQKELNVTGNIGKYTLDIIKNTNGVKNVEVVNGNSIKIKISSDEIIPKLFNILKNSNITNFYTTNISLNDIFIDKVGVSYEKQ